MVAAKQPIDQEAIAEKRHPIATLDRPLTEDDYWALPDDGNRYEIIGGELFVAPPPDADHQNASAFLSFAFYFLVEVQGLGWARVAPFGVRVSPTDVVEPDIFVLSSATSKGPRGKIILDKPGLVVEILSPSNRRQDLVKKRVQYQTFKIPEYWIVDPRARTIEVLVLDGEQYVASENEGGIIRSRVFPTIEIEVVEVFSGRPYVPATRPSTTG